MVEPARTQRGQDLARGIPNETHDLEKLQTLVYPLQMVVQEGPKR